MMHPMKIIALVTQKGGSGKSTVAANLAVAAQEAGEKVFLLETDKQGTLSKWVERRSAETPAFDKVLTEAQLENALVTLESARFSVVVIDTAGVDSPLVTAAIRASDLCLIPTRPTPADLEATTSTLEVIQALGKKFAFILNQTPARSARLNEAAAGLKVIGVLAEPPLVSRNDHQDALGSGLGVTEFAPAGKAAEEIRDLWKWVKAKIRR